MLGRLESRVMRLSSSENHPKVKKKCDEMNSLCDNLK